ncbi:MAG TPA: glycosyltransferase [Acidimicrobiales bacterium]|jgi:glycosyltransferase involved in cell wall biosynthesis|nr:glycosyltransferase [Acidimicrobiales bacterium]
MPSAQLLAVVVPAHNEELTIEPCLESIYDSLDHPEVRGIPAMVVAVLDDCSDTTGDRVLPRRRPPTAVIEIRARNVGIARSIGFQAALDAGAGLPPETVWLATTDADSVVPADWMARQLAWRSRGAQAVAGTVRVSSWCEQPSPVMRAYDSHMAILGLTHGHPHVHGANLSMSAHAYLAAGGMPPLAHSEDHALWTRLKRVGVRTVSAGDLAVETSARREGRAGQGFSDLLRSFEMGSAATP